jgi:hypothetical protein
LNEDAGGTRWMPPALNPERSTPVAQEQHSNTPTLDRRIEEQLLKGWLDEPPVACMSGDEPYEEDDCPTPASWSGRLQCGHCHTLCDEHRRTMTKPGLAACPCGKDTEVSRIIWSKL